MSTATERKMEHLTQEGGVSIIEKNIAEAIAVVPVNDDAAQIKEAHEAGVKAMAGSLRHFALAGKILAKVRDDSNDFSAWCKDNLEFNRKTAYQYIKLHELCVAGKIDLESGKFTSLRQCLGIDHDGEKSTYQEKRQSDMRFESIPGLCTKIEQFYKKATGIRSVSEWSDDEKRILRDNLRVVVDIYETLV